MLIPVNKIFFISLLSNLDSFNKEFGSHFRSESENMSYVALSNLLTVYLVFYLKEKRTYNLTSFLFTPVKTYGSQLFISPKIEIGEDEVMVPSRWMMTLNFTVFSTPISHTF